MRKIDITDSRQCFYESWIRESSQRVGSRNDFNGLLYSVKEYSEYYPEKRITDLIYYIEGGETIYVYHKIKDNIIAIVEFNKNLQNLSVRATAKKDEYKGKAPYISDLYLAALSIANNKSIKFTSDTLMTDEGFGVWNRLLSNGHEISVYDINNPGISIKTSHKTELQQYFGDSPNMANYRFILSENVQLWADSVLGSFLMRRTSELEGLTLDEKYKGKIC